METPMHLHSSHPRPSLPRRDHHPRRARHLLPRQAPHAAHGDSRRIPLQGQAHLRLLPPLRRPGGHHRRHGGRHHLQGLPHHRLLRPLHHRFSTTSISHELHASGC